jgi:hypothetical protein
MLGRLKFDITQLVDEILDRLPKEVWSSSTTTFLDPAIGGGQFVRAIESRLRNAGHSNENIASRVYGYESNRMRIAFAVNKYNLVGTYTNKSLLEEEANMKFDVVVGNPPYQSGNASKGNKLWPKFILKSYELTKEHGITALITPTGWASGGTNIPGGKGVIKDVFKNAQVHIINVNDITKKYFSNISIEIGYFILEKTKTTKETKIVLVDGEAYVDFQKVDFISPRLNTIDIEITKKIFDSKFEKFEVESFDRKIKKGTVIESETKTETHKFKHWILGGTSANNAVFTYLDYENTPQYKYPKILFNIGNRYWQPYYDLHGLNVAAQGFAIRLSGNETINSIKSVFEHPLFVYISFWYQLQMKGFMKTNIVKSYPRLDLTKIWKEGEIFEYFNISDLEQKHIKEILNANNYK